MLYYKFYFVVVILIIDYQLITIESIRCFVFITKFMFLVTGRLTKASSLNVEPKLKKNIKSMKHLLRKKTKMKNIV